MVKTKSLTAKILEVLGDSVLATFDIMAAILESGYRASYAELNRSLRATERRRAKLIDEAKEKQRFSNLVSKLKREGLIAGDRRGWKITKLGKEKLGEIREARTQKIDLSPFRYEGKISKNYTLVIFDIPEKQKEKRNWLREVLMNLDFKLLQKSVWIGKVIIPEEFLEDLRKLNVFEYVHIFSVLETGTIGTTGAEKDRGKV